MRGVSEVIAIILILMITIAITGLAYTFMSSTMASTTSVASSAVDSTTSSMLTSFTIESVDVAKVYIRNTGQNPISNLSVYVNDDSVIYNVNPLTIASGQVGTITIYSFIPEGATIKITSSSGFSASKVAMPCSSAIGCWRFDEGTGTITYDSSQYGNSGTLLNGASFTPGRYGSSIVFDGSNDYVSLSNSQILNISPGSPVTVSAWFKAIKGGQQGIVSGSTGLGYYTLYLRNQAGADIGFNVMFNSTHRITYSIGDIVNGEWVFAVGVFNVTHISIYVNGNQFTTLSSLALQPQSGTTYSPRFGHNGGISSPYYLNGTIDEVRIYNRAIY